MKLRNKALTLFLLIAPLTLASAACSSGGNGATDEPSGNDTNTTAPVADVESLGGEEHAEYLNELYEAAIDAGEDKVVVYGTVGGDRDLIYEKFHELFPEIEVQTEFLSGSDLFARVNQEVASGNMQGDLIVTGDTATVALAEAGRLAEYLPPLTEELDASYVDPGGTFSALTVSPFGAAYNTDSIEEADVPTSWTDFVDPKYEGQLAWVDLTAMGPSLVPTSRLLAEGAIDEAWLEDLKAQNVHFTGKAAALSGVIASGEYPLIVSYPYDYYVADIEKGAPIGFQLMDENNYVATNGGGLLLDAPHENAAKLLYAWLYTPGAQEELAGIGQYSPMPGAPAPEGLPALADIPQVENVPWTELGALNKSALETTKRIFG